MFSFLHIEVLSVEQLGELGLRGVRPRPDHQNIKTPLTSLLSPLAFLLSQTYYLPTCEYQYHDIICHDINIQQDIENLKRMVEVKGSISKPKKILIFHWEKFLINLKFSCKPRRRETARIINKYCKSLQTYENYQTLL